MREVVRNQWHGVAHGERRNPWIIIRQDLTLPAQFTLQTSVRERSFVVKRKDERRLKTSLKFGRSSFSPPTPEGPEEQFADRNEGKSCGATLHVAEIRPAAQVARLHQVRENVRVEQDDI